jgi:hypothetical protein
VMAPTPRKDSLAKASREDHNIILHRITVLHLIKMLHHDILQKQSPRQQIRRALDRKKVPARWFKFEF